MLASSAKCRWIRRLALCTKVCKTKTQPSIIKDSGDKPQKSKTRPADHPKKGLGGPPYKTKEQTTYVLRQRLRSSACSLLSNDYSSLSRGGVRGVILRVGHHLRVRSSQLRLPYSLLSALTKRTLRGVAS